MVHGISHAQKNHHKSERSQEPQQRIYMYFKSKYTFYTIEKGLILAFPLLVNWPFKKY
jgi:hypothetical protein